MTPARKTRIARAFGRAAAYYDRHAGVQRVAADRLAERIAALPLPLRPDVLEIGCGTGVLTAALAPRLPGARWTATDLSPEMVEAHRAAHTGRHAAMDGERPCFTAASFDLVCAGLAVQWFEDLEAGLAGLAQLVRPGGWLAVSTLLSDSLGEWRRAHEELGLIPATPAYPPPARLAAFRFEGVGLDLAEERWVEPHADATAFLASIRGIGAQTPAPGRAPLSAPQLRRVMARFDRNGAAVGYHLGYAVLRRPGP